MLNLLNEEANNLLVEGSTNSKKNYDPKITNSSREKIISLFVDWLNQNYHALNDFKTDELRQIFFILIFDQVLDVLLKTDAKVENMKHAVNKITDVLIDPSNYGLDNIMKMLQDRKFLINTIKIVKK